MAFCDRGAIGGRVGDGRTGRRTDRECGQLICGRIRMHLLWTRTASYRALRQGPRRADAAGCKVDSKLPLAMATWAVLWHPADTFIFFLEPPPQFSLYESCHANRSGWFVFLCFLHEPALVVNPVLEIALLHPLCPMPIAWLFSKPLPLFSVSWSGHASRSGLSVL